MRNIINSILVIAFAVCLWYALGSFAAPVDIIWEDIIQAPSISVSTPSWDGITMLQSFGFKILWFLKLFISGLALIYLVLIGVYMIVFSENEEKIKSQRKQIFYALMGFLFLNIPGLIYIVFLPSDKSGWNLDPIGNYASTTGGSLIYDFDGFDMMIGDIVGFLRVFIFWIAVVMFTWGFFRLIVSAGDEEARKQGKNRIIYGAIALLFLAFIEGWSTFVANADFINNSGLKLLGSKIFAVAIFFAAPVAVFFLIWGAYYYITSAGDEERIKKWKAIIINTFIATLILIAAVSFMTDLINFKL